MNLPAHGDFPKKETQAFCATLDKRCRKSKRQRRAGFVDVAESVLSMLKQRVVGDYMQTAAILDKDFHVLSGINTPNDCMGPGTGYRVQGERWEEIKKIPHIINPQDI